MLNIQIPPGHQCCCQLRPTKDQREARTHHPMLVEEDVNGPTTLAMVAMGLATTVTAVQDYPVPSDVKSLRSFLGLVSYYRRFVPNFAIVANPLFALTRKDAPYEWSEACQNAFQHLKDTLASSSVLAFPDFSKELFLETDTSKEGLGAVLSQSEPDGNIRPIAFASRTLQVHEKNYGSTEMEGLAVVWALKHFHQYLYGNRCQVFTDHEALKALLNTPIHLESLHAGVWSSKRWTW